MQSFNSNNQMGTVIEEKRKIAKKVA